LEEEFPKKAEPVVGIYASRILENPALLSEFVDYVVSWLTLGKELSREELIKVRLETYKMVSGCLKDLMQGWIFSEEHSMIHDLIKAFFGVL